MIDAARATIKSVLALGARHGVDPVVSAAIYIGAIPFFLLFSGLAIRRRRQRRPASPWIVAAGLCFVSAYLYLAVVGRGIPVWVWAVLAGIVAYGAVGAVRSARRKLREK